MKKILLIVLLIAVLIIIVVVIRQSIEPVIDEEVEEPVIEEPEILLEDEVEIDDNNLVFDKFGFYLSLPEGWGAEIKHNKEIFDDISGSFSFSFIPPEGITSGWFWGVLYLSVYKFQPNIEEFIQRHYPNYKDEYNLVGKRMEDIGGKPVFSVEPKDPVDIFWIPRFVILGTNYSYTYGFSQDGADGFVERIIEEIFPYINIE